MMYEEYCYGPESIVGARSSDDNAIYDAALEAIIHEQTDYEDAIQANLQTFVNVIIYDKATTNTTTTASLDPTQPEVKLPSVSLPTFSGTQYESWDTFWNKFVDAMDANAAIPKTTKFTYLQSQLRGEVLKVVCNLTLSNDSYDSAVQLLTENYADPERAVNF
ncbi:uncharacterized protein [Procambarus clarkii]|uniref:uncharacterized protein n=1 Tax=Procambarus clarkii TaxID=6728 RepID=UPI003744003B